MRLELVLLSRRAQLFVKRRRFTKRVTLAVQGFCFDSSSYI